MKLPELTPVELATIVWSQEEDMLIVHFYFDQSSRRQEMAELLARKSLDYLIERYRFINLSVGHTLQQTLAALASLQSVWLS